MKLRHLVGSLVLVGGLVAAAPGCLGALYYGNQYGTVEGGAVSGGTLTFTDNGTTVYGTFAPKPGNSVQHSLVFYLDTSRNSGFTSTETLPGPGSDRLANGVAGVGNVGRSIANLAPDFGADYAVALNPNNFGGALYRLLGGTTPTIEWVANVNLSPNNNPNAPSYTFRFDFSQVGSPEQNSFRFQSTYINTTGYRYTQSFEQIASGSAGFGTITFAGYNLYGVEPIPEMTNVALVIFGGLVAGVGLGRRWWRKNRA